jgi:sugar O-acyltransferase (sialic acid O-acetyltransferase NeuD family)
MQKLIVLGSSGHASVLIDAIELAGVFTIAGYLDDTQPSGVVRKGYSVLGTFRDAAAVCAEQEIKDVVIAIGDNCQRRKVYSDLLRSCPHLNFPVVRHPSAVIARSAEIAMGTALLARSHIGPGSQIGSFCILNTGSSLDHDCKMDDFASIAPGAFAGGLVEIGKCSAVGVGASISDHISIGSHSVVGTGSVVVRDIPDHVVAYGCPARAVRLRSEGEPYMGKSSTGRTVPRICRATEHLRTVHLESQK